MLQEQNYEFSFNLTMDDVTHSSSVSIFSSQVNALYKYQAIFYILIYLLGGKFCQARRHTWSAFIYKKYIFFTHRCGNRTKISTLLNFSLTSNNDIISTICQCKLLVSNREKKFMIKQVFTLSLRMYVQCIDNFTKGFLFSSII